MAATYPTSRRAFTRGESIPGSPALAGIASLLAEWENYTYNSDLPITPCDGKVFGEGDASGFTASWSWQPWASGDVSPTPQRFLNAAFTSGVKMLASVYVPPPRVPTSGVTIWAWVELGATNSIGALEVKDAVTGAVYSTAITYAACGSTLTGAWLSVAAEVQPGGTLEVWLRRTSGGSITAISLSGYHNPSTLWNAGAWAAISQAHLTDDRPLSPTGIRWLMTSANRFQAERASLQFLASYLGPWAAGNEAGWDATRTIVGKYKVRVGEKVTSIRAAIYAKADVAGSRTVLVKFDGATVHTFTVTGTSYAWQEASITIASGAGAAVIDVELDYGGQADGFVMVPSVSLWEETATLTLPGAETVPAAFVANDNGAMAGRENITSAQWIRLVENMVWIWSKRGLRSLVCDSRFSSCVQPVDHHAPGADHESQGIRRFRFADAAGVPRFLTHYHGWSVSGYSPYSWAWIDESGSKAAAAALTRVQWIQGATIAGEVQVGGTSVTQGTIVQARTSPPWVTAAAQTQDYESWCARATVPTPDITETRISGVIIEQMPKNQTAGTRA